MQRTDEGGETAMTVQLKDMTLVKRQGFAEQSHGV
jgi:hypothetical protein